LLLEHRKMRILVKRKVISILAALLAVVLVTSTVFAGSIRLKSEPTFRLGSLIVSGVASGLGGTNWLVEVTATGPATVVCTNNGSNDVPGQSSPKVNGKGSQALYSDSPFRKKGTSPFTVTAKPAWDELNPYLYWADGGCPNENWTARYDFVYWETATILVKDPLSGEVVATFNFACTTTRIPANDGYTFDDGKVSCVQVN
jgi:hypothetical protein